MHAVGWSCIAGMGLMGCAGTPWERAVYEGVHAANEQCQLRQRASDAPCIEMTDYARYERERARLKAGDAPPARAEPTGERQ